MNLQTVIKAASYLDSDTATLENILWIAIEAEPSGKDFPCEVAPNLQDLLDLARTRVKNIVYLCPRNQASSFCTQFRMMCQDQGLKIANQGHYVTIVNDCTVQFSNRMMRIQGATVIEDPFRLKERLERLLGTYDYP